MSLEIVEVNGGLEILEVATQGVPGPERRNVDGGAATTVYSDGTDNLIDGGSANG
jgi:hypothetical protein